MAVVKPSLAPSIKASYTLISSIAPEDEQQDDGEQQYVGNQSGIYTHFITANLCEQINERGKEKTDAANQDKYGLVQQVDALCNADGNDTDNGRDGSRYQCGDKDVRGLGGTHLRAIHHDADGDKYQSRGVEDKEHYHRIGGSILFGFSS